MIPTHPICHQLSISPFVLFPHTHYMLKNSPHFLHLVEFRLPSFAFLNGSADKESTFNVENTGDMGSIPASVRSPGEGNGNPLQYSCLGNPMDRGTWGATAYGVTKSQTWLTTHTLPYLPSFIQHSRTTEVYLLG